MDKGLADIVREFRQKEGLPCEVFSNGILFETGCKRIYIANTPIILSGLLAWGYIEHKEKRTVGGLRYIDTEGAKIIYRRIKEKLENEQDHADREKDSEDS